MSSKHHTGGRAHCRLRVARRELARSRAAGGEEGEGVLPRGWRRMAWGEGRRVEPQSTRRTQRGRKEEERIAGGRSRGAGREGAVKPPLGAWLPPIEGMDPSGAGNHEWARGRSAGGWGAAGPRADGAHGGHAALHSASHHHMRDWRNTRLGAGCRCPPPAPVDADGVSGGRADAWKCRAQAVVPHGRGTAHAG